MDTLFQWCVAVLYDASAYLGCTYEEINIYLFIIIHPLITLYFMYKYIQKRKLSNRLQDNINDLKLDIIDLT
jgi:hypothetical protein|tara:strand:- start:188 stop:403 length:216 start_codon:yes stop_codon:yes gene_type:complete